MTILSRAARLSAYLGLLAGPQMCCTVVSGQGIMSLPAFNRVNGHYYARVETGHLDEDQRTWDAALSEAATFFHNGRRGHLATVTSRHEDLWIQGRFFGGGARSAWVGGTDRDVEGEWRWAAGPEEGELFWSSSEVVDAYSNWAQGEPNDAMFIEQGEDFLIWNWAGGYWNDVSENFIDDGYIVEFSIPEPSGLCLCVLAMAGVSFLTRTATAHSQHT